MIHYITVKPLTLTSHFWFRVCNFRNLHQIKPEWNQPKELVQAVWSFDALPVVSGSFSCSAASSHITWSSWGLFGSFLLCVFPLSFILVLETAAEKPMGLVHFFTSCSLIRFHTELSAHVFVLWWNPLSLLKGQSPDTHSEVIQIEKRN